MILMHQIMAMEHIDSIPGSIVRKNLRRLARLQEDRVLETGGLVRENAAGAASAGDNLEVDKMDVYGMHCEAAGVVESPKLGAARWRFGEDAVVGVFEVDAVNCPAVVAALL